jgi:hypothetical protein
MATLAGNTIASTYPLLLKIDSSGIDGTLRAVQDGDATDSALSIATDSVLVKGDGVKLFFYDADGGEHISANTGGVLSIAGASEIDLTATAIDINGTVDMSSTLAVAGAVTAPSFTANSSTPSILMTETDTDPDSECRLVNGGGNLYIDGDLNAEIDDSFISFRLDNGSEKMRITSSGKIGIGETVPLGFLHVRSADSSATAHASADEIVAEGSANAGISILTGTGNEGSIYFGDSGDNDIGRIRYAHSSNKLDFRVNALINMTLDGTNVGIGVTDPESTLSVQALEGTAFDSSQTGLQFGLGATLSIKNNSDAANSFAQLVFRQRSTGQSGARIVSATSATNTADLNLIVEDGNTMVKAIQIDPSGEVIMAKQPAFSANPASSQDNIAINTNVTVVFGTEVFDQGGNFASNTFTAPVTGKYQLNVNLRIDDVDSAANYYYVRIDTSNRNYQFIYDPENGGTDRLYNDIGSFSVLADMDTSDTAYVVVNQNGGTQQSDVSTESYFSGFLAC